MSDEKQRILNYVMDSPANTNEGVLRNLLENMQGEETHYLFMHNLQFILTDVSGASNEQQVIFITNFSSYITSETMLKDILQMGDLSTVVASAQLDESTYELIKGYNCTGEGRGGFSDTSEVAVKFMGIGATSEDFVLGVETISESGAQVKLLRGAFTDIDDMTDVVTPL